MQLHPSPIFQPKSQHISKPAPPTKVPPPKHSRRFRPTTNPAKTTLHNPNQHLAPPTLPRYSNQPQWNSSKTVPSQRRTQISAHPQMDQTTTNRAPLPTTTTNVCNNCRRLGHYAQNCTSPKSPTNCRTQPMTSQQWRCAHPRNQHCAYFITDSSG